MRYKNVGKKLKKIVIHRFMQKGFTKSLFFKHFWGFSALESRREEGALRGLQKRARDFGGGGEMGGGKRDKNEVSRSWSFVSVRRLDFYDRAENKRLESKGRGSEKDF
jgi:hypothetical protein